MNARHHILIVDDSPTMRETLRQLVEATPDMDAVCASDPFDAVARMRERAPDAILLDLEMPKMDGVTFLRRLMAQHPLPVVICSSQATPGSKAVIEALQAGALEAVQKPGALSQVTSLPWDHQVIEALRRALAVPRHRLAPAPRESLLPDVIIPAPRGTRFAVSTETLLVIGASTGGTRALATLLAALPPNAPGIVVVQHMPEAFTEQFAHHLDTLCSIEVRQAKDGDPIETGVALIAPGGKHTLIARRGSRLVVEVRSGPPVNRHRPSVDVLFRSAAIHAAPNVVGAILTGMGDDGARCMKELHEAGATTFAQDEETCVVFGMPKEAIALGGVDHVLPLQALPAALLAASHKQPHKRP